MKKLTIFANFLINSEERFLRMKDSFKSFEKANIDYLNDKKNRETKILLVLF